MKKILFATLLAIFSTSAFAQYNVGTSTTGKTDYWGNTTTTHKDQYGRTTGTSTTGKTDYWGNTTTTHKDQYGRTIGTSTTSQPDYWGNTTTINMVELQAHQLQAKLIIGEIPQQLTKTNMGEP